MQADRDLIKELRLLYRDSTRRERTFYWQARLQPPRYPNMYMTCITDGATQTMYLCPRFIGLDHGRDCLQVKLVGTLFHGHCYIVHLVYPHVPDDANLVCHCLDTAIEEVVKVRVGKDQPDFLPPNFRTQLDGVSTNWGSVTFAHHHYLQLRGLFGEKVDVVRNRVGSTHEDIDATFGVAKEHLKFLDIISPLQLKTEIARAFATLKVPVVILDVDATLDYRAFYAEHIDPKLGGYG